MELADLARTMARYRWLILLFVVVGVGSAWLMHYGEAKMFTASTRLVLDTPDPESRAESAVIADTAKAIATSPSQVREALTVARVTGRDPDDFARRQVTVRALGSSGIVQLSVRDRDPKAAALIANALAVEVIETRLDGTKGVQQVLRGLDKRITGLNRRISTLDAKIFSLAVAAEAAAGAASANAFQSEGDRAERQREALAQQRSVAEGERVSLLSTEALQLTPSVISEASPPASADTTRLLPDMVLAGLLALIFGVGAAGLIEMVRPTAVRGGSALARKFNTALLGTLPGEDEDKQDLEAAAIAARLTFAADAAGVTNVSLLGIGRPVDINVIARRLEATLFSTTERVEEQPALAQVIEGQSSRGTRAGNVTRLGRSVGIAALDSSGTSVRPHGAASPPAREGERTGLVIVSPVTLSASDLDAALQLVRGTPLPLLGLIATASTPPQSSELGRPLLERQHQPRTMP